MKKQNEPKDGKKGVKGGKSGVLVKTISNRGGSYGREGKGEKTPIITRHGQAREGKLAGVKTEPVIQRDAVF